MDVGMKHWAREQVVNSCVRHWDRVVRLQLYDSL